MAERGVSKGRPIAPRIPYSRTVKVFRMEDIPDKPPAPVDRSLPVTQRMVALMVFVWDYGDRTTFGDFVERFGSVAGPAVGGHSYPLMWCLVGRRASLGSVQYAVRALTGAGYVIDVFAAVHGYPILLGDGREWHPGPGELTNVRLFYTTACHGEDGVHDFVDNGADAYVAASGINFVTSFHMFEFFRHWRAGATASEACARANAAVEPPLRAPGLNLLGIEFLASSAEMVTGSTISNGATPEDYDRAIRESRPHVFGQSAVTITTDLAGATGPTSMPLEDETSPAPAPHGGGAMPY